MMENSEKEYKGKMVIHKSKLADLLTEGVT